MGLHQLMKDATWHSSLPVPFQVIQSPNINNIDAGKLMIVDVIVNE